MLNASNVPLDILFEIFTFCYATEDTYHGAPIPSAPSVLAYTLTHVCRTWRVVAVGMQPFWSTLIIKKKSPMAKPEAVRLCLDRTTPNEIDVQLINPEDLIPGDLQVILSSVITSASRWRSFSFETAHIAQLVNLFTFLSPVSSSCLKDLAIVYTGHRALNGITRNPVRELFKAGAPLLRRLKFGVLRFAHCLPPLASITTLTLESENPWHYGIDTFQELREMLEQLPSLRTLKLVNCIERHEALLLDAITLPSLLSLSVSMTDAACISPLKICRYISSPNLECLYLGGLDVYAGQELGLLNHHPGPRYPYLRMHACFNSYFGILGPSYVSFLQRMDNLTHLLLMDHPLGLVVEHMKRGGPVSWPRLHTLTVLHDGWLSPGCRSSFPVGDMARVCNFVTLREEAGKPLSTLRLSNKQVNHFGMPHALLNQFKELVKVESFDTAYEDA